MRLSLSALLVLTLAAAAPAVAQDAVAQPPPPDGVDAEDAVDEDAYEVEELVVTGQRPRGQVLGDIAPEITLGLQEILAIGAGSLSELLEALGPQIASGRGRGDGPPITLLNGRRISGFREIRSIPPEAIERVEILPEEVALKYGYRADQRVVNIVLRRRFRAVTAEAEVGGSTGGGAAAVEADLGQLRINRDGRSSLDFEFARGEGLLESERDIALSVAPVDLRPFRSLAPERESVSLTGTVNRVMDQISGTLNGSLEQASSESGFGLSDLLSPLERSTDTRTGHLGVTLDGPAGEWRWTATGNYDRTRTLSRTDARVSRSPTDRAESTLQTADVAVVLNGVARDLPAGPLSVTVKAEAQTLALDSWTFRRGEERTTDLSRQAGVLSGSLDLPLADRDDGILPWLGELSLNANLEQSELSDFGALTVLGFGASWSPLERLDLIASFTDEDAAPTVQQLGDPVLFTPDAQVFDFASGQTVDVTRITGGNPGLSTDTRRVLKLGATLKPFDEHDLRLSVNYTANTIEDPVLAFPALTPAIEAAFPERFLRDADGTLLQVDARPVNFSRSERSEVRYGVNYSRRLGPPAPARGVRSGGGRAPGAAAGRERPPSAGGRRGFGGGGLGRAREGRLQLALYHTVNLEDRIDIRPGGPELDLLDGGAVGSRGGVSRHELDLQVNASRNGFGARLDADWRSGTTVRGGRLGDLDFSGLSTVNLRLFADLGQRPQLVAERPWLRGVRVSLTADNLFDSRPEVRDSAGLVPISYQPDRLDPEGRTVRLSLRKLFAPARPVRPLDAPRRVR